MTPPRNQPKPVQPSAARAEPEVGSDEAEEIRLVEAVRAAQRLPSPAARARAWEELLLAFQDRLYGVCFRMVRDPERARDLTQDAMVKVIQGLDSYDGRARLSTWMIRVTMNVCLSHLRKEKLRRHASLDVSEEGGTWAGAITGSGDGGGPGTGGRAGREPDMLGRVEREEARRMVLQAMDMIDPDQRAILTLRDVQDLDYRDIAEALDIPLGTVKSRIFRAREALRGAIESLGGGQGRSDESE
ncbi:MAG: sigma-70 family RNA polymerase sigma factor [Phycisphaerales bacterium]|nr:sigma-70 family RNA polymerase sigma factor [Phycisphaerales bacterium]